MSKRIICAVLAIMIGFYGFPAKVLAGEILTKAKIASENVSCYIGDEIFVSVAKPLSQQESNQYVKLEKRADASAILARGGMSQTGETWLFFGILVTVLLVLAAAADSSSGA